MREVVRRRWRVVLDVVLALFLAQFVLVDSWHNPNRLEMIGGLLVVAVSVGTSRRWPEVSLATAMCAAGIVPFSLGGRVPVWEVFVLVSMSYLAGLRMSRRRAALITFAVVAGLGLPYSLLLATEGFSGWGAMVGVLAFASIAPWQLGRYVRLRGDLARTGWRRAEEMESRQRIIADQARLRERARIASDMHDSLGHELSLIAVRAAALEVCGELAEPQRKAVSELRENAATATERLREIIGVLREDAAPVEPVQGDLGELIDRARASGLLAESEVDIGDAPPMVARAAHRVVQEALTNVAKHAPGAAVRVVVARSAEATEVRVVNDPPPAGPLPNATSGARGLIGLRERVRLVGGTLRAGPYEGGFEVAATLPHHGVPVEETPESREAADAGVGRSTSARELELARRDVRRSLVQAIVVPLGLFALIVAISGVVYVYQWYGSELSTTDFDRLRVGESRAEFAAVLPDRQRLSRPVVNEPPRPPGASCEYYGTDRTLFDLNLAAYRLCFVNGLLVSKDRYSEDEIGGKT